MTWLYQDKEFHEEDIPPNSIGFLYKITNKETGQWYIGRKLTTKSKIKVVNGKKKKSRVKNDWEDYWSSNDDIKEIAKTKPETLERKILIFVPTLGAMAYGEEFLLYASGALFDPLCKNGNIRAKIMRNWFNKIPNLHSDLTKVLV